MTVYTFRCKNCSEIVEKDMNMRVYATTSRNGCISIKCPKCNKVSQLKRVIALSIPVIYADDGFTLRKKEDGSTT